jgi:GR25 family glycosyltransferase involved in LPS biosynthesis
MNFKTYCLSLKSDVARRNWMISIKEKIGLDFEFFDAVTPEEITDDIVEKYFEHANFYEWDINQKAVMATFMSHMKLLELAVKNKENILIIEDDTYIIRPFNWNNIDFSSFDVFKISRRGVYCYAYFVSYNGAINLLNYLNSKKIELAYDWELEKCRELNIKTIDRPVFIQTFTFPSNIAPNGYKKIKNL